MSLNAHVYDNILILQSNQTILGVMGTDVTTKEMQEFIPKEKLGSSGYAFAINNNGYVIFHPKLKAQVSDQQIFQVSVFWTDDSL